LDRYSAAAIADAYLWKSHRLVWGGSITVFLVRDGCRPRGQIDLELIISAHDLKSSRMTATIQRIVAMSLAVLTLSPITATASPFVICHYGQPNAACVVDGDTIWFQGEKFRAQEFDAPEMGPPKCKRPAALAKASRAAMLQLLNSGDVYIERTGTDRYGRTLARITVNGQSVSDALIAKGLARPYRRGEGAWC
jgi:endonuclease YncB( thermonuclease family)